jgi:hypothetical protein
MATHPKHATNGNGNGTGGGSLTQRKIEQLLQHHEQIAAALRTTLGLLTGTSETKKKERGAALLVSAIRLDASRREGRFRPPAKKKPALTSDMIRAQRKRTAVFLAGFNTEKPTRGDKNLQKAGLGTMIRYGYLRAKGDGYVRTAKTYNADVR